MTTVAFRAAEYRADTSFQEVDYEYAGSTEQGWVVSRDGETSLLLGPGYRLLQTQACGVCSTDLARHHLPFPLPQITGHEVLAVGEDGQRYVVEINASHQARGVEADCPFCRSGLETHCPERLVLGIHDLPGGFGPYLLAPVNAVLPVPEAISPDCALLVEPFAAALHAVTMIQPRDGDRIAVLGPRRLGMLIVGALAGWRRRQGLNFEIVALARREAMLELAATFGAGEGRLVVDRADNLPTGFLDVVIDSTGNPGALELALRLAKRGVHLKSTHGQPACGLTQLTALVVDEIAIDRFSEQAPAAGPDDRFGSAGGDRRCVAWLASEHPPAWLAERCDLIVESDAATALKTVASSAEDGRLPRADIAVVSTAAQIDAAIRPSAAGEISLVRPRGEILIHPAAAGKEPDSTLIQAIVNRGVRLSSSRCGDFRLALDLMAADPELLRLGEKLITHRFDSGSMSAAFRTARSAECIKAVVEHSRDKESARTIETSLGYPARPHGSLWVLDLTNLPLIHGLSVLSRALAEEIVLQAKSDRVDINVERTISARENPELLQEFGVRLVKVSADHESVLSIAGHPEACEEHLRALLGYLQRRTYREALLPPRPGQPSAALVADFSRASTETPNRFVMEFVRSSRESNSGFLRITIEHSSGRRLDVSSIPHLVIEDIEGRNFIAGSTRIAQTWAIMLRREAERGRRYFYENRSSYSHLFRSFDRGGLGRLERVAIHWSDSSMPLILEAKPSVVENLLKRVLLALEDAGLWAHLSSGGDLRVDVGELSVFLDVSHIGRVLNLSLGRWRRRFDIDDFLRPMPALLSVVERAAAQAPAPLANASVFLIHHMTSEVLGLIAALRRLGCRDLTCLFVVYGAEAPASYLEAILDLPPDEFRALALVNVSAPESVEGHYRLSSLYSVMEERAMIEAALEGQNCDYLTAMRAAAVPAFLSLAERSRREGRRCVIVEDGGYLQPILQAACLSRLTVGDFASAHGLASGDARPLEAVLSSCYAGGVEHTRNGLDRLTKVEAQYGRLAFPAFSIAVSRLKVGVESREVAVSILNAVETVLHSVGRILSRRRCLIIGSHGAIGSHLCRELVGRLENGGAQILRVDLKVSQASRVEAARYEDLGVRERLAADLILGVAGESVLSGQDVAAWLLHNPGRELMLASGSTKTVEFADVAHWLDALLRQPRPALSGRAIEIRPAEVVDAHTGRVYGHRYSFQFGNGQPPSDLVFLAGLTPVNFLFYGVPAEAIDGVLAQLATTTLGLVRRSACDRLPLRLQKVDYDVDADGNELSGSTSIGREGSRYG